MGFGFFDDNEYFDNSKQIASVKQCGKCGLHKRCNTPKMKPSGRGKIRVLWIAEAPGEKEDLRGEQLIGKAGQRLRKATRRCLKIELDDCRKMNAINCRPPKNRKPKTQEIDACRPMLLAEIKRFKPHLIVPMGSIALQSLLGHRWHKDLGGIQKWRGFHIPDRELGCWIAPTYHPSFILRSEGNPAVEKIWYEDLSSMKKLIERPLPTFRDEREDVRVLTEYDQIRIYLKDILNHPPTFLTLDYETTGLKPHARGHRIVCCSFCHSNEPNIATAFKMGNRIRPLLKKILTREKIKKIAQNMKFEELWTRVRLGHEISPWFWDTMLATHCLDNRRGITSLKFQAYVKYGLIDYDSHIERFLKSKEDDNANSFNQIFDCPLEDLLIYCGIDSLLEHRLAFDQMKQFGILDPEHYAKGFRKREREVHESIEEDFHQAERRAKRGKNIKRGAVRT